MTDEMADEEKILWMFEEVHGEMTGSCYTEVEYDDFGKAIEVSVMKGGNVCWSESKADLVFSYLIKIHFKEGA